MFFNTSVNYCLLNLLYNKKRQNKYFGANSIHCLIEKISCETNHVLKFLLFSWANNISYFITAEDKLSAIICSDSNTKAKMFTYHVTKIFREFNKFNINFTHCK